MPGCDLPLGFAFPAVFGLAGEGNQLVGICRLLIVGSGAIWLIIFSFSTKLIKSTPTTFGAAIGTGTFDGGGF